MKRLIGLLLLVMISSSALAAERDATLQWLGRVELSTPVSGTVAEVLVLPGQVVTGGQELLRLDARGFEAEVAKAAARVDARQEAFEEARREWERAEELYERTVLSDHELQLAKIAFVQADADLRAARAELATARLDLEYSVLRAPFDAIVVASLAAPGQTVVTRLQTEPLLVLARAGEMIARVVVGEPQLGGLTVGGRATVLIGERRFDGRIAGIGMEPVGSADGVPVYELQVRFAYDPNRLVLRAGQRVRVALP